MQCLIFSQGAALLRLREPFDLLQCPSEGRELRAGGDAHGGE